MKIAVVGSGISGLVAARELHGQHDVTVFEAGSYIGGHTNTLQVKEGDRSLSVDTGFIVFNRKTYPNFCGLLAELGVEGQPSQMSFSVRCDATDLEYNGTSLNGLFAQRRNLWNPRFWRMASEIKRFYREAPEALDNGEATTLGQFLGEGGYSSMFIEQHLVPMGAAIWSARAEVIMQFPLKFLVQFFHNHGFLQLKGRPQWLVVQGGSKSYIPPLVEPFRDRIQLNTPVTAVRREGSQVLVRTASGEQHRFDRVVLACHADQSLRMVEDGSPLERELLSAFPYQKNHATLHTDASVMPRNRRAWASWNYHVLPSGSDLPVVTYWMNELQGLESKTDYFVTLNRSEEVRADKVIEQIVYHHPVYSETAVQAQRRHGEIDGHNGLHFCGAYWGFGFHEDGVRSGLRVAERVQELA
ncbi:MAG: FAD-dependent oxidoreductase, partial [Planctomycetota bacterium]|nr:FAD-dependent oxidoreductase [Planctomycetota bacterium]